MRCVWVFCLAGLLSAGCQLAKSPNPGADAQASESTGQGAKPDAVGTGRPPRITPINEPSGRVAFVHPTSRFVVIDFHFSPLPRLEQRLGVYRQGQKVGEVKISGPDQSNLIAADIIAGDAKVGDEVRPD